MESIEPHTLRICVEVSYCANEVAIVGCLFKNINIFFTTIVTELAYDPPGYTVATAYYNAFTKQCTFKVRGTPLPRWKFHVPVSSPAELK